MSHMIVLELRERGATAALPGLATVIFDGHGSVRFRTKTEEIPFSLPQAGLVKGAFIELWSDAGTRTVLLHASHETVVVSIDLDRHVVTNTTMDRDLTLQRGLWQSDFLNTALGPLMNYELGVIAFNKDGSVRWKTTHANIQWLFDGVEGDRVVYRNEAEGALRYRLDDGRRE